MTEGAAGRGGAGWRRYPSMSLEHAVDKIRTLYNAEKNTPAPIDLVAQHFGFKNSKTGPASTAISAVKQFGLIDESGTGDQRRAVISQRGRAILSAPPDIRERELKAAALEPTANRMVWDKYKADVGSPVSFQWYLTNDLGFSETGAREFARQYLATLSFAGLDTSHDGGEEPAEVTDDEPTYLPTAMEVPRERAPAPSRETLTRVSRHAIPLIGGKQVILEGDFPLSEEAWQGFMAVLVAFKPGLVSKALTHPEPNTDAE